jgi:hypothetical protein
VEPVFIAMDSRDRRESHKRWWLEHWGTLGIG